LSLGFFESLNLKKISKMMVNLKKIVQNYFPDFKANLESINQFLDIFDIIKNKNLSTNVFNYARYSIFI